MLEKKIEITQEIDRRELFGNLDVNLDIIKEETGVEIFQRDNTLILRAEEQAGIDHAEHVIGEMTAVIQAGEVLDKQKMQYIIALDKEGVSYSQSKVDKDIICFTHKGKPLKPKTLGQKQYVNSIRYKDVVFGIGPAGTGKTYIAEIGRASCRERV